MTVQKLGYKTQLVIDTAIYHKGRSTFNVLQATEKLDVDHLLKTNKAYLDAKHGLEKPLPSLQKKSFMRMV